MGCGLRDLAHPARQAEAEHQRSHPRRRDVQHVEPVPNASSSCAHQPELIDQLERGRQSTLGQRRRAEDHRRTLGRLHDVTQFLGHAVEQLQVTAKEGRRKGRFPRWPDHIDLGPRLDRLTQPDVEQCGFPADMAADDQDRVGGFDARKGRIEIHRRKVRHIIGHAGLARFGKVRPASIDQSLGRKHCLGIEQIARHRRDARLVALESARDHPESFAPFGRLQPPSRRTHTRSRRRLVRPST